MGEYVSMAPLGYLNKRNENGRGMIVLDPDRAPLVKKLFEEYATGQHTLSEMLAKAEKWGLRNRIRGNKPICKSHLHNIFNNPFYYGVMKVKDQLYPHCYEPLIHKELFEQCQAVLKGWHKKPFQYAGKEFVFRGLITCATTGRVVTASEQKRTYKNGEKASWTYLRCWNPENPEKLVWVREEKVLAQVEEVFRSLQVLPDKLEYITRYVRDTDKIERAFLRRQMADLKKDYTSVQNRLDGLMDLLLDGTIDKQEFERMAAHEEGDDRFKESLIALLNLSAGAWEHFKSSTTEQKRRLVGFLFANLELKGTSLCYSLKEPFCWFEKCSNLKQWSG